MKTAFKVILVLFSVFAFTGYEPDDDWLKECKPPNGADIGGFDDGGQTNPDVDPGGGTPPGFDIKLENWEDSLTTDLDV